ncbi:MAG: cell wall hydrolase [Pseudomonadota bacterium]
MRVVDTPFRMPRSARRPVYWPGRARASVWRRLERLALLLVLVPLFSISARATGEQSILALVKDDPATWSVMLGASNLGFSLDGGATTFAPIPPRDSPAQKGDRLDEDRRLQKRAIMPEIPGVLASADAASLPRVSFVARPEVDGPHTTAITTAKAALASKLTAYAPDRVDIETPFRLLLGASPQEGRTHGISGGGRDHWWSDRPLPKTVASKKSKRCLAQAIYFEARGESERGQRAVAQVVINRVKNPAYPDDVCGVVFQNRTWRNRCQFTFACDRVKDVVRDKPAWKLARSIAAEYSAGTAWLDEIGASTHYHADYVRPRWARLMRKVETIDRHIFYITHGGGWT